MASGWSLWFVAIVVVLFHNQYKALGGDVGINYGRYGRNLRSPTAVVNFLTGEMSNSITLLRISDANPEVLEVLRGTKLVVSIVVPNEDVRTLAASRESAADWVSRSVRPFVAGVRFRYIAVGNELIPGDSACLVLPAMANLHAALGDLTEYIRVTTAVPIHALAKSFPPSAGEFSPDVAGTMKDVANFLHSIGSPIMINVFPYFALAAEPHSIPLEYALFQYRNPFLIDEALAYYNLFDAMVDAFAAAVTRVTGSEGVNLVVAETGWPTGGATRFSGVQNARIYNNNVKKHAREVGRTPRLARLNMEVYIVDMFDEDLHPDSGLRSFGTFHPNLTEVYPLWR